MDFRFKFDPLSWLKKQLNKDAEKKARENAKAAADPVISARISAYRSRYPNLTPGVTLSAAKAGYDPDGDEIARLALLTGQRRAQKGQGWYAPKDVPQYKDSPDEWFKFVEADDPTPDPTGGTGVLDAYRVFKPFIRATAAVGQTGGEALGTVARAGANLIENGPDAALAGLKKEKFTALEAAKGVISGHGAGLGQGFLPNGPTTRAQAEAARSAYSISYSDSPIFTQPGADHPAVEPHAGTTGRILWKDILEPGSFWFNIAAGATDAATSLFFDPVAKASKVAGELKASSRVFTAAEAGRTAGAGLIDNITEAAKPSSALAPFTDADVDQSLAGLTLNQIKAELASRTGQAVGRRSTISASSWNNWLTMDKTGQRYVKAMADEKSAYTIWKLHGAEGSSKMPPRLARAMADTDTPEEMVALLSPELGVSLRHKPEFSAYQSVVGYEGVGIKNNIRSVRALQTMPKNAVDLADDNEAATQLVRSLQNHKVPEEVISRHFDELTRTDPSDIRGRTLVFDNAHLDAVEHVATQFLEGIGQKVTPNLNRNFSMLRGVYRRDNEALELLNRMQASRGTVIRNVVINGEVTNPIRSHYNDLEELSQIYRLPNPREVRRVTSTFGRLLNLPGIDQSVAFLDHINNFLKGSSILRPALMLRVHGEEHARMAVSGYDTMFNHPRSYTAFLTGRKGTTDLLGNEFDGMTELTAFRKSLVHQADLHTENLAREHLETIPFTDKRFAKAWANDIQYLNEDPVMRRLAGAFGPDDIKTGDNLMDAKRWLASDDPEAVAYRVENEIDADLLSPYVDNQRAWLLDRTFNQESLVNAVATGTHDGQPILSMTKNGPRLSKSFQAHLRALNDADKAPMTSVGDMIIPASRDQVANAYRRSTDWLFSHLLTKPGNYLNRSVTFKQQYFKSAGNELMIHASPEAQAHIIQNAVDNNLGKDAIKALRDLAKKGSGDLTIEEVDTFAKARALDSVRDLFYDLSDRNQFLDVMRLIWPFGEAWKEGLTAWAKLSMDKPQIIPRALMTVNGLEDSGFFYTDPQTGEEMFAYPGGHLITRKFAGGIPSPITAQVQSLNMITGGGNPLMPGFGVIAQEPVNKLLPDLPKYDSLRDFVMPYGDPPDLSNPWNFLPSWAQKMRDYIGAPAHERDFAELRMDAMRYLYSTGNYDTSTQAGQQALVDKATQLGKRLSLIRGLAQATLPASPTFQDVAVDKDGTSELAFVLKEDYRQLLERDRNEGTNLAVSRFIAKYGENNILYMQSASGGGEVFNKAGYDWVRENKSLTERYPDVYALFAPDDGGFDMKAYHALFERGDRKPLSPREALDAAQNRVAKMAYRNAQDKLPEPNKRTDAQKAWLRQVKDKLLEQYPGFVPEFQGSDIPDTIRSLQEAVDDPKLAKNPQAQAIREYLGYRDKVIKEALSRKEPIVGWQTAKATKSQRAWLRNKAAEITAKYPSFKNINRELFNQELGDDD